MSDPDMNPASPSDGSSDRLVAGRYRLVGRRGTGLDVALFEAVDVRDDRTVAVKVVHPDVCAEPGFAQRFDDTMPRVASMRHPNLTDVLDHGSATWNGHEVRFVVTENLTGGSLRDLRDRGRTLTPSQAVMVGLDVCRALDVSHRAGLIHGDIRPTTLMFGADGRLRVADLGLGHLVADDQWADPGRLSIDRAKYASPEQARGLAALPASDVYALCLCLLEAVTGQLPFVGDSTVATLSGRLDKLMPVSADLGPLAAVLERAGRPDPADRYSAAEFGRALVQTAEKLPRPTPVAVLGGGVFEAEPAAGGAGAAGVAGAVMIAGGPARPIETPAMVAGAGPSSASSRPAMVNTTDPGAARDAVFAGAVAPLGATLPGTSTQAIDPADRVVQASTDPHLAAPATAWVPAAVDAAGVPPPPPADDEAPAPLERSGRRRLVITLLVVLSALAAGGVLGWFVGRTVSHTVPALAGIEQGEALNMVSEFAWDVTIVEEFSDDVPLGTVIDTDPAAGTSVDEGGALAVTVSKGPAPRVLPDITGATVDEANATLVALGLALQVDQQVFDETVPAGTILSWSVPSQPGLVAGDTVLPGTLVSAVTSGGPEPRVVPTLAGLSLADGTAQLAALDLVLVQAPDEFSTTVPAGSITRQDPAPGVGLAPGTSVTVAVSKGPDLVVVPPLAGLTPDQAAQTLTAAGFTVGAISGDPAGVNIGSSVNGVQLAAGQVFPRGTTVDLVFGVPAG
jgi:beta-lactam-binding protein with PASTA domain